MPDFTNKGYLTREERKRQLDQLKDHPEGWRLILGAYIRAMFWKQGIGGTPGMVMDDMIEEILNGYQEPINCKSGVALSRTEF